MIYRKNPEFVDWNKINDIFRDNDILIQQFKLTMKDCYGEFVGDDWKIAIAELIENLSTPMSI